MELPMVLAFLLVVLPCVATSAEALHANKNVVHLTTETSHPGGIWKHKTVWKPRWVKEWHQIKVWKAIWKKVWGPLQIQEWIPLPKPPTPHHEH